MCRSTLTSPTVSPLTQAPMGVPPHEYTAQPQQLIRAASPVFHRLSLLCQPLPNQPKSTTTTDPLPSQTTPHWGQPLNLSPQAPRPRFTSFPPVQCHRNAVSHTFGHFGLASGQKASQFHGQPTGWKTKSSTTRPTSTRIIRELGVLSSGLGSLARTPWEFKTTIQNGLT